MGEHGLSRLLLGLAGADPDRVPTPSCPPLPRFRRAVLRDDWTEQEQRHKAACAYCRETEARARRQAWHPSPVRLFWHARGLLDRKDEDVAFHLDNDACRRCRRLAALLQADRLLGRLAARVRQKVADAASRLGRTLASAAFTLVPPALPREQPLAFESAGLSATLLRTGPPRLRLECRDPAPTPKLLRVLVGGPKEPGELLAVLRAGKEPGTLVAEVSLDRPPAEGSVLALYEVDAAILEKEDISLLQSSASGAAKLGPQAGAAWQAWAAHALKLPGLDAAVRSALEGLARAAGPPKR